jgi:hypothetical protein
MGAEAGLQKLKLPARYLTLVLVDRLSVVWPRFQTKGYSELNKTGTREHQLCALQINSCDRERTSSGLNREYS